MEANRRHAGDKPRQPLFTQRRPIRLICGQHVVAIRFGLPGICSGRGRGCRWIAGVDAQIAASPTERPRRFVALLSNGLGQNGP